VLIQHGIDTDEATPDKKKAESTTDVEVLGQGGSIATYATNAPTPGIPFWELVFVNARIFFVGSDDVPADAKIDAARAINQALEAGWQGLDIGEVVSLRSNSAPMNWSNAQ
jgi:NADPH:quinone reductase